MGRTEQGLIAFNRGLISNLAASRVDLKRAAFSAEDMINWMPRSMGSMMLRPGWAYKLATNGNAAPRYLPFVFANDDKAKIEFTTGAMRIVIDDVVLTRPSVSTTITNPSFTGNITGWTDNDEVGGTSVWVSGDYLGQTGNGTAAAIVDQTITVGGANINVEHGLRIVVQRGPVVLRVGSTSGGDEYINETALGTGTHCLSLTPGGNFFIRFLNRLERQTLVASCDIEAAGAVSVTSPYLAVDLDNIRGGLESQSGDVIFLACDGYQQRKIERRAVRSWSLVLYQPETGPFALENTGPITITPSAIVGNITLTASAALFRSTQVGALWSISSSGQQVTQTATAQNTFTSAIQVTGVDAGRVFSLVLSGLSGSGSTVTLQRSLESDAGPWTDVTSYTTNQDTTYDDTLDNQIIWYRIGVKTGGYSAGTIVMTLTYTVGSIRGIVRITAVATSLSASAEVLRDLGGTAATDTWAEGEWSDRLGWPTAVSFYEGRLGWAGKNGNWLSVSDQFDVFDDQTEGDSGPIAKTIGSGPVDIINWMLPLQQLLLGGQMSEYTARSTAFDEPLTPTNCNIKPASTQGSAAVQGIKVDSRGLFVQRGGTRVFEAAFSAEIYSYEATDLTAIVPDIGKPRIVRMGVQRQPDTRVHCVRSDGTVAVLVYDKAEKVLCWLEIDTDGLVEDVIVLPGAVGDNEDEVSYVINRTINGSTVRYLETWALEEDCVGGTLNKQADSFIEFTNSPASATVTGLTHLIGEEVVVWTDGVCLADAAGDIETFTVNASGQITLTNGGVAYLATTGIAGLAYEAPWQSSKLGTALTHLKKIDHLGLVLLDCHPKGLRYGPTLTDADMNDLPAIVNGAPWDMDAVAAEFDQVPLEFPGEWSADARLCLKAMAPRPVTVSAAVVIGEVYA